MRSQESDVVAFVQLSDAEPGWHRSVYVKQAHGRASAQINKEAPHVTWIAGDTPS